MSNISLNLGIIIQFRLGCFVCARGGASTFCRARLPGREKVLNRFSPGASRMRALQPVSKCYRGRQIAAPAGKALFRAEQLMPAHKVKNTPEITAAALNIRPCLPREYCKQAPIVLQLSAQDLSECLLSGCSTFCPKSNRPRLTGQAVTSISSTSFDTKENPRCTKNF